MSMRWPILVLVLASQGCFSLGAALLCPDDDPLGRTRQSGDCGELTRAAGEADSTVIDAARANRRGGTLMVVATKGFITRGGAPVEGAAVRLRYDGDVVATVRSGAQGAYGINIPVSADDCEKLTLVAVHPDGSEGASVAPGYGETSLDYDFAAGSWVKKGG